MRFNTTYNYRRTFTTSSPSSKRSASRNFYAYAFYHSTTSTNPQRS